MPLLVLVLDTDGPRLFTIEFESFKQRPQFELNLSNYESSRVVQKSHSCASQKSLSSGNLSLIVQTSSDFGFQHLITGYL